MRVRNALPLLVCQPGWDNTYDRAAVNASKRMRVARALLLACCLAFFPCLASAVCYSGHPSVDVELKEAKFVVIATAKKARTIMSRVDPGFVDSTIYEVSISKSFKGKSPRMLAIKSKNTSTRFPMEIGVPYLLFVERYNGSYFVDSCGNSNTVSSRVDIIKTIEKGD